ncbi:hypothetical protein V2J09_000342 [Rumex salicifolius]
MVGSVRLGLNMNKKIKKPSSKQAKRGSFVKELVNYLKSDSFLYPQLISSSNSADSLPISTQDKNGIEMKESEEYLKSDTYMYAPLLKLPLTPPKPSPPPPPPPPQPKERSRNQVQVSSRNVYATTNVEQEQYCWCSSHGGSTVVEQNVVTKALTSLEEAAITIGGWGRTWCDNRLMSRPPRQRKIDALSNWKKSWPHGRWIYRLPLEWWRRRLNWQKRVVAGFSESWESALWLTRNQ